MDALTVEKIKEIIASLEKETVNIATNMNLGKQPTANYSKTRDLINIGSVILWLKSCLRSGITNTEFENKVKSFEEVTREHRYTVAGKISHIAYLANRLAKEQLEKRDIAEIISEIIRLDDNRFYTNNGKLTKELSEEDLISRAKSIANEASKDAAKIIRLLLYDKDYIEKVKQSGYRIDEEYTKAEHHLETPLQEQILSSQSISDYLNKILKQIKQRTRR